MSDLGKTERLKLIATLFNTVAAAAITIGILSPILPAFFDGTLFTKDFSGFGSGFVICICAAVALHLIGQGFLTVLDEIDED
uniref:Uncharacterized protein n=1 Tax=Rhodopseudomonas palustris (strain BisA53) TaxID=316055 RepID=Q07V60_RHOP5